MDSFFGAQIRLGERVADLGRAAYDKAAGNPVTTPSSTEIPLLRVVNGANYEQADRAAYFQERAPAYAAENEVKGLTKAGGAAGAKDAYEKHKEDFVAAGIFHAADHQRAGIYKQIEALEKRDDLSSVQRRTEFDRLRKQDLAVMNMAREQLLRLKEGAH